MVERVWLATLRIADVKIDLWTVDDRQRLPVRKWFGEPRRIGPSRGVSRHGMPAIKAGRLQARGGKRRPARFFLPCRRSWVRVPSAASKALQTDAFLGSHHL